MLSEEAADDAARLTADRVWIVDPLDGTREYGEGRSDWAVHVALVVDGTVVASAVALPGLAVTLDRRSPAVLAPPHDGGPRLVVSRTRPPAIAEQVATALGGTLVPLGSAGAKAMAVVRGEADVYLHSGGQYEWDSAAPVGVAAAGRAAHLADRRLAASLQPGEPLAPGPADLPARARGRGARRSSNATSAPDLGTSHRLSPMDLRRLRLFLAVVDEGGFTRAAEAMFVSQPSVSQAIRELEDELGTPLFHRVGRGVVLTSAGEALVGPARQVLRDVEVGEAAVASVTGLVTGRLDLCSLPTLAVDPVAPLVGAFRLAYPGVTLALADPDDSADLVHLVSTGACELGVDAQPAPGRLESRELASQDLLAVFPPGTLAPRGAIGIDRLAEFSLVTSPDGHVDASAPRRRVRERGRDAADRGGHRATGGDPAARARRRGRHAARPSARGDRAATRCSDRAAATAVSRTVFVLWRAGPLSPAAQAFLDDRRHRDRRRLSRSAVSSLSIASSTSPSWLAIAVRYH